MKWILTMLFWWAWMAFSYGELSQAIIIDILDESPEQIIMVGRQRSPQEMQRLLQVVREKLRVESPVIIRVQSNANVSQALRIADLVAKTHSKIFIGLNNPDPEKKDLVLLQVRGLSLPTVVPEIGEERREVPAVPLQYKERSFGQEQLYRIEQLQRGELP